KYSHQLALHTGGVMRRLRTVLATAVSVALLPSGVAIADSVTTDFDDFAVGSVDGQGEPGNTWRASAFDQEVVANGLPSAFLFGTQSFRLSNAVSSQAFANQTFSPHA